ncbi:MAG TPA: hypothetical protein ENK97_00500 [Campylobacteraceae bacterium]|nr:hypothetical protein [Campylobacteraceae bacterium]
MQQEKYVIVIEYPKGSDKGPDQFRPDTKPIMKAIMKTAKCDGEVVFYTHKRRKALREYLLKVTEGKEAIIISRINPGNLKNVDAYFQFLNRLSKSGMMIHTHPDVMINLDFKDILYKLKEKPFCDAQTQFYRSFEAFEDLFPVELKRDKRRVLKVNYGSTGEGVYLIQYKDDGSIISTEAVNNVKYYYDDMDDFLAAFEEKFDDDIDEDELVYFKGKSGFVDCRYLPRISEGEIRVLIIKDKPVSVVHKKPQDGAFSATLFSGAKYAYDKPDNPKWRDIITLTLNAFEDIKPYLQGKEFPLLWTMDYILDYDDAQNDRYILSEINCSCVGITTEPELAAEVGKVFA